MKPRDFWIRTETEFDHITKFEEDATPSHIHVREVSPEYDKAVDDMVTALRYLSTCPEPFVVATMNGGDFVMLGEYCKNALANFDKVKG